MSTRGKISDLFDLANIQAQQKEVLGMVDEFIKKVNTVQPIKLGLEGVEKTKQIIDGVNQMSAATQSYRKSVVDVNTSLQQQAAAAKAASLSFEEQGKVIEKLSGSLDANIKLQTQYKVRLGEITSELKQLNKETTEAEKRGNAYREKVAALTREQIELKTASSELASTIKNQVKENQSAEGSIDQLQARVTALQNAYESLSDVERQQPFGQQIKGSIDQLEPLLKGLEGDIGKFQRNVGNYSGALQILEKELANVKKNIDDYNKSGRENAEVLKQLTKEEQLLEQLLNNQVNGFASATQELRNNEKALQALAAAGQQNTVFYQDLLRETAQLKDNVGDLKAEIKALASDTSTLDGLIQGAQTLAGIYGIAQGAAALFGNENEELQKTLVKLQAVTTILNGLQGIQNALQKESSLRLLIKTGLQKIELLQINLATAAESKNIVVRYAAIAAQKTLNAVMAANPIVLVVGALALITTALVSFTTATKQAALDFETLNTVFEVGKKNLEEYLATVKQVNDEQLASLQASFSKESEIRKQQANSLAEQLKTVQDFERENRKNYTEALKFLQDNLSKRGKASEEYVEGVQQESESVSDELKKQLEDADQFVQNYEGVKKKREELASQLRILIVNNEKATTEEIIKARQTQIEIEKLALNTRAAAQQAIVGNDKKTFQERIAAAEEFGRIQQQLIIEEANRQKLTPGQTPEQIKLIEAQKAAAQIAAKRESTKQIEDLTNQFNDRERKAQLEIIKQNLQDQINANELIVENEKKSYSDRLDAAYAAYNKRRDILTAERDEAIRNQTITASERIAIEEKYTSDINQLTVDYGLKQRDLLLANEDLYTEAVQKGQQKRLDIIATELARELSALNLSLANRDISIENYERQRAEIEKKYSLLSLKQEIDNATAKVFATKKGTAERAAAEKELAEKTVAFTEAATEKQKAALTELSGLRKQLASEALSTLSAFVTAQYDKEKNAIQDQITALDEKTQKEIENANATIANEQDKAAAIATINARALAEKERLEQRQRQIDIERARFEKAANIAQIIASTAAAIIETFKTYKGTQAAFAVAAAIGAIGAVQLAKAIATPIPKFAKGTDDAPGGLSWVGDGGRREVVATPDGRVYITDNKATLVDLPQHSVVLPDADSILRDLGLAVHSSMEVAANGRLVQRPENNNRVLEQKIDKLTQVVANKREIHIQPGFNSVMALHKYGNRWNQYIDENINF